MLTCRWQASKSGCTVSLVGLGCVLPTRDGFFFLLLERSFRSLTLLRQVRLKTQKQIKKKIKIQKKKHKTWMLLQKKEQRHKSYFHYCIETKYSLLWWFVDRNKNAVTCKYSVKGNNNKTSVSLRIWPQMPQDHSPPPPHTYLFFISQYCCASCPPRNSGLVPQGWSRRFERRQLQVVEPRLSLVLILLCSQVFFFLSFFFCSEAR